ncbi:MAG TPA: EF-hand domain-containing protein [Verrucomicrobiae bacterium]|nr:EF-hand domain-containing protein [Verrucomicrobiae bacterium]
MRLSTSKVLALSAAAAFWAAVSPTFSAPPGGDALADLIIDQFDTSGDTIVGSEEWQYGIKAAFQMMDEDGDGVITGGELGALEEPIGGRIGEVGAKLIVPIIKRVVFSLDADKNGCVSSKEFADRAEGIFKKLDADVQGTLSRTELAQLPVRLFTE